MNLDQLFRLSNFPKYCKTSFSEELCNDRKKSSLIFFYALLYSRIFISFLKKMSNLLDDQIGIDPNTTGTFTCDEKISEEQIENNMNCDF